MKIKITVVLGLVIGLSAPARAFDDDLWTAVVDLSQWGKAKEAERSLRAAGRAGLDALLAACRLEKDTFLVYRAADVVGCQSILTMSVAMQRSNEMRSPGNAAGPAAELAARIMAENPAWARQVLSSEVALERSLALVSFCGDLGGLLEVLEEINQREPDPGLLQAITVLRMRFRNPKPSQDLEARIKLAVNELKSRGVPRVPDDVCLGSDFGGSDYVKDLASGRASWHGGAGERYLFKRKNGQSFAMSSVCLLESYKAVRAQGKPPPRLADLLSWVVGDPAGDPKVRAQTAEALISDLDELSEFSRKEAAATLVNAGFQIPFQLEYDDSRHPNLEVLEATIRQGADTREAVIPTLVCPRFDSSRIVVLGFSDNPAAADRAAQIAMYCPNARTAATAALIRLGDSRARGMLFTSLIGSRSLGFESDKLVDSIDARGGSDLLALIEEMAAAGNRNAKRLQDQLRSRSR